VRAGRCCFGRLDRVAAAAPALGVGPPELLRQHGIEVRRALPAGLEPERPIYRACSDLHVLTTVTLNRRAVTCFGLRAWRLEYALFRPWPSHDAAVCRSVLRESDPGHQHATSNGTCTLSLDKFGSPLHISMRLRPPFATCSPTIAAHVRIQ